MGVHSPYGRAIRRRRRYSRCKVSRSPITISVTHDLIIVSTTDKIACHSISARHIRSLKPVAWYRIPISLRASFVCISFSTIPAQFSQIDVLAHTQNESLSGQTTSSNEDPPPNVTQKSPKTSPAAGVRANNRGGSPARPNRK